MTQHWVPALGILAVTGVAHVLLWPPLPLHARLVGGLLLFIVVPGFLLIRAVFHEPVPEVLEEWLLALGCGCVLAVLLTLLLYGLFRPLHTAHMLMGADLLIIGLLLAALARGRVTNGHSTLLPRLARPSWPLPMVLLIAAPLRLLNLGHSELQGDEAKVVLRTAALLQGVPDALHAHYRPPGEILLNATLAGALGAMTELHGRLPFAFTGVVAVAAMYHLARAMFGVRAGLAAGLLLAVNGYFVAFGRVLQYESLVLLLDILAVLCLIRFTQGSAAPVAYAIVGALLLAGSALTAFSAIFLLPVAAVAILPRVVGQGRAAWSQLAAWLWPWALLVPCIILVYVILARGAADSSEIPSAASYLRHRLGQHEIYFNLDDLLSSTNHYTSGIYTLFVLAAGIRGAHHLWSSRTPRGYLGLRVAVLWLAGPFLAHLLLVRLPLTHWREVFPGLILLAGCGAAAWYGDLAKRRLRPAAMLGGGLFLAATAHFVYVSWLQPWPEYQSLYPSYRHPLDWNAQVVQSGGLYTARPRHGGGIYGAAHHHGWKTVAELIARGELPAEYDTNEREAVSVWYLKQPRVCPEDVRLYIHAPNTPRAFQGIQRGETPRDFVLAGRVYVDGRPMLALSTREPPPGGARVYQSSTAAAWFEREHTSPWLTIGQLYRSESPRSC